MCEQSEFNLTLQVAYLYYDVKSYVMFFRCLTRTFQVLCTNNMNVYRQCIKYLRPKSRMKIWCQMREAIGVIMQEVTRWWVARKLPTSCWKTRRGEKCKLGRLRAESLLSFSWTFLFILYFIFQQTMLLFNFVSSTLFKNIHGEKKFWSDHLVLHRNNQ